ncbi:MAG: hypothetical protein WC375_03540 [Methanomassiliicoccales archaeon]|jgi:hypothetical protein
MQDEKTRQPEQSQDAHDTNSNNPAGYMDPSTQAYHPSNLSSNMSDPPPYDIDPSTRSTPPQQTKDDIGLVGPHRPASDGDKTADSRRMIGGGAMFFFLGIIALVTWKSDQAGYMIIPIVLIAIGLLMMLAGYSSANKHGERQKLIIDSGRIAGGALFNVIGVILLLGALLSGFLFLSSHSLIYIGIGLLAFIIAFVLFFSGESLIEKQGGMKKTEQQGNIDDNLNNTAIHYHHQQDRKK